jgi:large subunit ribosomal protein L24
MRTAKALQKIKHIKHMRSAIKHHEATRAKKEPIFKERFDGKQARLQEEHYHAKFTRGDVKKAKRNYKEDWALGPLRPNRAVGENAELYGAMEKDQLRWPDVPVPTQRMRNKLREKAGLDPEWPIVIDDRKVYPFVKGDRVVVIRGKEMNKIGIIENINEDAHMVELKDVNKVRSGSIFSMFPAARTYQLQAREHVGPTQSKPKGEQIRRALLNPTASRIRDYILGS